MADQCQITARLHGVHGLPVDVRLSFVDAPPASGGTTSQAFDSRLVFTPVPCWSGCGQREVSCSVASWQIIDATLVASSVVRARAHKFDGRGSGTFVTMCIANKMESGAAGRQQVTPDVSAWAAGLGLQLLTAGADLSASYCCSTLGVSMEAGARALGLERGSSETGPQPGGQGTVQSRHQAAGPAVLASATSAGAASGLFTVGTAAVTPLQAAYLESTAVTLYVNDLEQLERLLQWLGPAIALSRKRASLPIPVRDGDGATEGDTATLGGTRILKGGSGTVGALWRAMYSGWMDAAVLLVIVTNIAGMAADEPWFRESPGLQTLEFVCSLLYTVEMLLKVTAMEGMVPYLRDPWQSLDAFIVIGGWLAELPALVATLSGSPGASSIQLSALRGLRALRALRTVQFLKGVRDLLETMAATARVVMEVLAFNVIILACLAATGAEAFGDALGRRCALPPSVPAALASTASQAALLGYLSSLSSDGAFSSAGWPWAGLEDTPMALTGASALRLVAPARFCSVATSGALTNATALAQQQQQQQQQNEQGHPIGRWLGALGVPVARSSTDCGNPLHQCVRVTPPHGGMSSFATPGEAFFTTVRLSLRAPGSQIIPTGLVQATSPAAIVFFVGVTLVVSFWTIGLFVAIVRGTFIDVVKRRTAQKQRMHSLEQALRPSNTPGAQPSPVAACKIDAVVASGSEGGSMGGPGSCRDAKTKMTSQEADLDAVHVGNLTDAGVAATPAERCESGLPLVSRAAGEAHTLPARDACCSAAAAPDTPAQPVPPTDTSTRASDPSAAAASGRGLAGLRIPAAATPAAVPTRETKLPPPVAFGDRHLSRRVSLAKAGRPISGAARLPRVARQAVLDLQFGSSTHHAWLFDKSKSARKLLSVSGEEENDGDDDVKGLASEATGVEAAVSRSSEAPRSAPETCRQCCGDSVCLCLPRQSPVVAVVRFLVLHPRFDQFVMALILLNTVCLGMEFAGMSKPYAEGLALAELVLTCLFALEMITKIVGLGGIYNYAVVRGSEWNRFDAFVVCVTLVDLILVLSQGKSPLEPSGPFWNTEIDGFGPTPAVGTGAAGSGGGINLSVLRVVRVVRVLRLLKLVRGFDDLKSLVRVIGATLEDVGSWVAVTGVMLVTFAIAGMQFFGGTFRTSTGATPRANFDSFGDAMLSVCRMMAGGGTWGIVQSMMQAPTGQAGIPGYIAGPLFFGLFMVVIHFQLLNFLTVLVLSKFSLSPKVALQKQRERNRMLADTIVATAKAARTTIAQISGRKFFKPEPMRRKLDAAGVGSRRSVGSGRGDDDDIAPMACVPSAHPGGRAAPAVSSLTPAAVKAIEVEPPQYCLLEAARWLWEVVEMHDERDRSVCGLFPRSSCLRKAVKSVIRAGWFESVVLLCIVLSSLALAAESPTLPLEVKDTLAVVDLFFLGVFWVECALKIVAFGFVFGHSSYLRGGDAAWNIVDFVVVVLSTAAMGSASSGIARVGRLGRVMRPLRAIRRNPQMRIVTNALLRSIPSVSWTLLIVAGVFVVWAILGVSLFAGKLHGCTDPSIRDRTMCIGFVVNVNSSAASSPLVLPRVWSPPRLTFDSFGAGLASLFEIFTLRSWLPLLHSVMDATDYNLQPRPNSNPAASLFILVFIWITSIYLGKLFIGVIVAHFRQFSGSALLTPEQSAQRTLRSIFATVRLQQPPPAGLASRWLMGIVTGWSGAFEISCALIATAHWTVVLWFSSAIAAADPVASVTDLRVHSELAHWIFVGWYALELLLRTTAHGGFRPASRATSISEVVVEVALLILLVLLPLTVGSPCGVGPLRTLFAASRVIARKDLAAMLGLRSFRKIVMVIGEAMPALLNVTALVLLFLYTWAVLGTQLFSGVRMGSALTPSTSFETFGASTFTLLQMVLGLDWTALLQQLSISQPGCTSGTASLPSQSNCGSPEAATFYFFAWHILFVSVLSNLYTAAILDEYSVVGSKALVEAGTAPAALKAEANAVRDFAGCWTKLDKAGTGSIAPSQVRSLLRLLVAQSHPFVNDVGANTLAMDFMSSMVLAEQLHPSRVTSIIVHQPFVPTPTTGRTCASQRMPHFQVKLIPTLRSLQRMQVAEAVLEPYEVERQRSLARLSIVLAASALLRQRLTAWRRRSARSSATSE